LKVIRSTTGVAHVDQGPPLLRDGTGGWHARGVGGSLNLLSVPRPVSVFGQPLGWR
jgi:hypothetical protein